jgi:hypothetical protein
MHARLAASGAVFDKLRPAPDGVRLPELVEGMRIAPLSDQILLVSPCR